MQDRILVFAPHPDDETLGCGGTIAKEVGDGNIVHIVFLTDGRNSHKTVLGIQRNPDPEEVKVIRRGEAQTVARLLGVGVGNLTFMDYVDGYLTEQISRATERVRSILASVEPNAIFAPDERDLHRDHQATNTVVKSALDGWSSRVDLYKYLIWSDTEHESAPPTKGDNSVQIDISAYLELKRKAIATYRSQTVLLFPSQTRPVLLTAFVSKFLLPIERFCVESKSVYSR